MLYPSLLQFSLTEAAAPAASNTLLATLREMIDRRQAALPPNDVPFRPQVRFLIRPNSLRTFHMTYPVLDALPVPKTRQNLAADDDVQCDGVTDGLAARLGRARGRARPRRAAKRNLPRPIR